MKGTLRKKRKFPHNNRLLQTPGATFDDCSLLSVAGAAKPERYAFRRRW
jgi:hypothetical protein